MDDALTPEQLRILALGAARARAAERDAGEAVPTRAAPNPYREGAGVAGGAPRLSPDFEPPLVTKAREQGRFFREHPPVVIGPGGPDGRQLAEMTYGAVKGGVNMFRNVLDAFGIDVDKNPTTIERAAEAFLTGMSEEGDPSLGIKAGELASEAYGVGKGLGLAAKGVRAAAPLLEAAGMAKRGQPALNALATAVETGGLRTGVAPKSVPAAVANQLLRVTAGAGTGAAAATATGVDPYWGAATGAVLPGSMSVVAKAAEPVLSATGKAFNTVINTPLAKVKAAMIIRDALGPDAERAMEALRNAPSGMTAAQALENAGIKSEAFQSLAEIAKGARADEAYNQIARVQDEVRRRVLESAAGGSTEAQQYAAREIARGMVNATTGPEREAALSAADETGRSIIDAQRRAALGSAVAEEQTAQAKRLLGLSERQAAKATAPVNAVEPSLNEIPMLRGPEQRQAGAFARQAELKGEQAARLGRIFGESRRSAEVQLAEYEANGLKPLTPEAIVPALRARLSDPKFAGNKPMRAAYTQLIDDLEQARLPNGLIDADALAAIRKNSVNDTLSSLLQGQKPKTVRKAAAAAMSEINPLIDKAIEDAGGAGWSEYLSKHATMMHELVDRKTLAAEALRLYNDDPKGYVKLLRGGKLNTLTKVFGPGAYNIVDEMGPQYAPLAKVADEVARDLAIKRQITDRGAEVARDIIESHTKVPMLPRLVDYKIGLANEIARSMQINTRGKAMQELYDALQSGRTAAEVYDLLPRNAQGAIERAFGGRKGWIDAMDNTFRVISQATIQSGREPNTLAQSPRNAMSR